MFGGDKTREFQQGMDQHGLRRGREQDRLSLRRKKREEQLQRKRRQIMASATSIQNGQYSSDININSSNSPLASTAGIKVSTITIENLDKYILELKSSTASEIISGTMCIRILLSKADITPPYKQIVDSGIVPILLSFFKRTSNEKLQFEAAWAVTNLSSSTKEICEYLCSNNAIKAFEHLLRTTKHFEIMEQAVWGLGNIAGESQELRNIIIKDGIFEFLLERCEKFLKSKNYTLCRNAVWCLSNLVRYDGIGLTKQWKKKTNNMLLNEYKSPSDLCPWNKIKNMIPIFNKLLNEIGHKIQKLKLSENNTNDNSNDKKLPDPEYQQCLQCCSDCLWTIQYSQIYIELSPNSSYISDVFNTNLIDLIIIFMQMDSVLLLSPSLRIIGTFLCGDDVITEMVINKNYLCAAMLNLNCKVRMIRKEVCWTLSNIAGCERNIAIKIIEYENGQLLKSIINACLFDDDQVKKEAGWVLANIISLSDPNIIHFMVQKNVIGALRAVMKTSSVKKPLITCMEAFDIIMSHTKARDNGPYDYISKVEESGCCEIFDILQAGVDDNDKVFTTSYELVNKYWPDDNDHNNIGQPWIPIANNNNNNNNNTGTQNDANDVTNQNINNDAVNDNNNNQQFEFGITNQNNNQNNNNNTSTNANGNDTNMTDSNNGNNNNNNNNNDNNNNDNNNNQPFQF